MDHKQFVASLSAEQRRQLTTKKDLPALVQLTVQLGLILALGILIGMKIPFWWVLMLPQGILIIFLFTLLHESLHATVFKTKILNTIVGYVCGFLILIPPLWFSYFHFAHHRYTQDPKMDPELAEPKPETFAQYVAHISGIPTWSAQIKTMLANARGKTQENYIPARKNESIRIEGRIMLKLYVLLFVLQFIIGSSALLYAWLIPVLLGQPFLRLYLLAEHGRCPFVENMFLNTRTTMTTWIVRKLAWNMPYHAEHHAMPSVPFHALPKLHKLTEKYLGVQQKGYVKFHQEFLQK